MAVLLRPDDGRRRGRGPAIAALVISSVWIALIFGLFILGITLPETEVDSAASSENDSDSRPRPNKPNSGIVASRSLEVGYCLPKVPQAVDYTVSVQVAPCSEPHRAEMYAVWNMGGGPYPSVNRLIDTADDGCMERFSSFIGHDSYSSNLEFTYLTPDDRDWRNRMRTVTCIVYAKAPFTETLRGSRR